MTKKSAGSTRRTLQSIVASHQRGGQFVVPMLAPAVVEGTLVVPAAVVEEPGAVVVVGDVAVAVVDVALGKLLVLLRVVAVAPVVDGVVAVPVGVVAAPVPVAVVAVPVPVAVVAGLAVEVTGQGFEMVELPVVPFALVAGAGTVVVPA